MDIIINNGAEAVIATAPTEVIAFVGKNGVDGETPDLLDYVRRNELGDLAFDDLIELASLGTTIIIGGYIKTQLIDANAIRVQGNLATIDQATALANIAAALALTDFSGTLGDLAFENLIEASKLGTTIIQGGYINSVLLDVNAIRVQGGYALASDTAIAIQNAATALATANSAKTAADQATIILNGFSSDNLLAAFEKPPVLKEWQAIQGEKPIILAQATKYTISYSAYETAFNDLGIYIDPLVSDLTTDSSIDGALFRLKFKTYYDSKVTLLKAISDEAKDLADAASAAALAAAQAATGAQNAVDALSGSLGELAFENAVTLAKLDDTIIVGGYIKTTLLDVTAIRVAGSLATTSGVETSINNAIGGLGDLAFLDLVSLSKLDTTVIVGGYINTSLIDADYIKSSIITASYIETLDIVAHNIATDVSGNKRIIITNTDNNIRMINSNNYVIFELDDDSALYQDPAYVPPTPPLNGYPTFIPGVGIEITNPTAEGVIQSRAKVSGENIVFSIPTGPGGGDAYFGGRGANIIGDVRLWPEKITVVYNSGNSNGIAMTSQVNIETPTGTKVMTIAHGLILSIT